MQPGNTVNFTIGRQTASGKPSSGKLLADFIVSAYLDGVSTSVSPTITEIGADGNWQEYKLAITAPATAGRVKLVIQPVSGYDSISPSVIEGELEANDLDSLANYLLMSQGTPSLLSAADSSLGDIVDGDTYLSATLTMPSGKLSPFGITDITAAGVKVEAAIMGLPAGGTSYPITATVVSGLGLTFTIGWPGGASQPHPALPAGSQSATWYIDVQVVKTATPNQIITTNRYSFTQQWQRDTRIT